MNINKLIHIVGSEIDNMNNLRASGDAWAQVFKDRNLIQNTYKILDYGAGLGRLSIAFQKLCKVVSVDGNPAMVKYLIENNVNAYHIKDDWQQEALFDFAISTYVLQHNDMKTTQQIVKVIGEVTNKFYFTYPIYENLSDKIKMAPSYIYYKYAKSIKLLDSHDVSRYVMNLNELSVLFSKSKFDFKTIRKVNFVDLYEIGKTNGR